MLEEPITIRGRTEISEGPIVNILHPITREMMAQYPQHVLQFYDIYTG